MDRSFFAPAPSRAVVEARETGEGSSLADRAAKRHVDCRAALPSGLLQRFGRGGLAARLFLFARRLRGQLHRGAGAARAIAATEQYGTPPRREPERGDRRGGEFRRRSGWRIRDRFVSAFDTAPAAQDIVMATPDAADYLVRGYLNAVPEGDGTALTYVLDIFDAKKHRTQRVEDQILLKATAADPWSVVDDSALSAVAAKSAAALAAVLTNTPQAVLAAAQAQPATAAFCGAGGDGRPHDRGGDASGRPPRRREPREPRPPLASSSQNSASFPQIFAPLSRQPAPVDFPQRPISLQGDRA